MPVGTVFRRHLAAILLLGALNLLVLLGDLAGYHGMLGFSRMFRVSDEANFPNLFSTLAIGFAALVALRLAQAGGLRDGERKGWIVFAILFGIMALDEAIQLHEQLSTFGHRLDTGGPWLNIGVFVYLPVAAVLAVLLFGVWARQSRAVRIGFVLAGLCYASAAIGVEIFENMLQDAGVSIYDWRRAALFSAEELGEMLAVALFLRTFLVRFAELGGGPLLALVGARTILAIEIPPPSEQLDLAKAVSSQPAQ